MVLTAAREKAAEERITEVVAEIDEVVVTAEDLAVAMIEEADTREIGEVAEIVGGEDQDKAVATTFEVEIAAIVRRRTRRHRE
ncbi:MAG: hypothetical protein AAF733_04035 [Verrucomicrobiota bacterium]